MLGTRRPLLALQHLLPAAPGPITARSGVGESAPTGQGALRSTWITPHQSLPRTAFPLAIPPQPHAQRSRDGTHSFRFFGEKISPPTPISMPVSSGFDPAGEGALRRLRGMTRTRGGEKTYRYAGRRTRSGSRKIWCVWPSGDIDSTMRSSTLAGEGMPTGWPN
jgi:hypothetical protein